MVDRTHVTDRSAVERAYEEAATGALAVAHPAPGILHVEGATWLDLLQRMSTNDLANMRPGEVRQTVLTTAVAQIVDVVWVLAREHDGLLVASPGRGRRVLDWLKGHIFFNDDVRVAEVVGWESWGLYGPRARQEASRIVPNEPPTRARSWTGGAAWEVGQPADGGARLLLTPDASAEARRLWGAGTAAAAQAYEILRVEAGIPEMGAEILDDSLPLEVGLKSAVSFSKGCYIGQEIIARMESRGRLAKELMGVEAASSLAPGEAILLGGRNVGRVTSAAVSPRLGPIALASVRPASLEEPAGGVEVGERKVRGRLVRLPFKGQP